jgi:hypothetical protein
MAGTAKNSTKFEVPPPEPEEKPLDPRSDPIGGSAALRESQKKHDANWLKGATGEYLMDKALYRRLNKGSIIITDRKVPETMANIDHLVVASSGVWIIDSKNWEGKIEYKPDSFAGANMRLFVGGEDRTAKIKAIYGQVIPIAQIIGDRSVDIFPAVAFIEGDWSLKSLPRLIMNKPYKHGEVVISPPCLLIKMINKPGQLDAQSVVRIGKLLDESLPAR